MVTNSNSERRVIDDCIRIFHKKEMNELNELDLTHFRLLVKEIDVFEILQKEVIDDLIRTFQYYEVKEGTVLMEKEEKADVIILLRGEITLKRFHTVPSKREIVYDHCFTIVGDLTAIEGPSWKYDSVVASKNSAIIKIDYERMRDIGRRYELLKAKKEKFEFIIPCLPNLNKYTQGTQRKVNDFFVEKKYRTGHEIVIENSPVEIAYLIKSGECEIKIRKHPFDNNRNITDTHEQEKIIGLMKRGGYNSETVSNFNIGRLAPKQWFGEEGMLLGHDVYMYSIIAASQVIVYEITKEKFGNLPSEVKSAMILSAKNKISWILSRKSQVTEAYTQIFCMNEDRNIKMANDGITAKTKELNDIVESFPKASGQALEKIKTRKERLRSADIAKKNKERIPSLKDINPLSPRNNNAGSMKDLDTKPGIKVSRPQTAVSRIRGDETFKFPISPRNEYGKISENNSPTHSPDMTILNPKPEPKQEIETVGDKTYVYKSGHGIKAEPRIYLSIFKMETSSRTYRTQKNKLQEVMKVGNKSRTPSPDPRPQSGKAGSKERSKSPSAGTKTNPSSAAQTSRPKSGILKDPKPIRTDDEQFWTATGTMTGLGTAETLISPKGKTTFTLKSTNETQGHHKVRNSIGLIVSPTKSKHRSTIVGLDLKRPMTTSGVRLKEDRANMVVFKEQTIDGFGLLGIKNHRRLMMSSIFKPAELRGYITSPASNVK